MQCLTWLNLDMISSYSELYFFKCIAIFNSFSEVPINHSNETSAILKVMVMGMFWTPWIFLKEHIRHLWSWKTVWKEKYALFWNYSQKQLLRKQTHFNENQTWVSKTNGLDLLWLKTKSDESIIFIQINTLECQMRTHNYTAKMLQLFFSSLSHCDRTEFYNDYSKLKI